MPASVFSLPVTLPPAPKPVQRGILRAMQQALTAEYNYHRAMYLAGAYTQAEIDTYEDQHDALMREIRRLERAA